ncbi:MAG: phosphate uptake regulator PhoU [Candidatus Woesearchaeota archaeon]|nr:phosphate uptake regulator PhoU [Candidatus Woesearchaeota archaeon]
MYVSTTEVMLMIIRRLVKAGQASHTISLPKEWLDSHKLKKGDLVYLYEKGDRELVISPESKVDESAPLKETTIPVDNKELSTIQREITSAYINNYNTIVLTGQSITQKTKDIRKILHDFVALEVADQTATSIIAKDLLNLKEISIDKTLRRMDMLVRSMIQDSIAGLDNAELAQSVVVRDYEVNRAYFLLMRLLKSSLSNRQIADFFQLSNSKVLSYYYLTINLENFADCAKQLAEYLGKEKKKDKVKAIFQRVEKGYLDTMKGYFTRDKKLADSVALSREELLKDAGELPAGVSELFRSMVTLTNNIVRLVIDEE